MSYTSLTRVATYGVRAASTQGCVVGGPWAVRRSTVWTSSFKRYALRFDRYSVNRGGHLEEVDDPYSAIYSITYEVAATW